MLRNSEMEFEEIVKNTGKSKSTISVHLKSLREENIISFKIDANDNRKKIFYLNSEYLGSMDISNNNTFENNINEVIRGLIDADEPFATLLFQTFRSMLIKEGVNIDPILNNTGKKIGANLFDELYSKNLEDFIENIAAYWKNKGLGTLSAELGQIIRIYNLDCFECMCLPKTGKPICYLDAGIFESLFSLYFDMPVKVTEIKCYTMGDEMCTFEIEALGN